MNAVEKTILIGGFLVVWGYPLIYMVSYKTWAILVLYILLTAMFFIVLRMKNCIKCINLSCPLNNVDTETKIQFLKNNPEIQKHWENNQ